jgi:nicotinate-nucleotide adenylyltransferase
LRLALAGQTRFSVETLEVERGGVSYSIETVRALQSRFPEARLFWLIGADHVVKLPLWREAEALARSVEFVVIPRPGEAPATLPEPYRLHQLTGWPLKVSASEIRERVRRGQTIRHLVPEAVADSVEQAGVYREMTLELRAES